MPSTIFPKRTLPRFHWATKLDAGSDQRRKPPSRIVWDALPDYNIETPSTITNYKLIIPTNTLNRSKLIDYGANNERVDFYALNVHRRYLLMNLMTYFARNTSVGDAIFQFNR